MEWIDVRVNIKELNPFDLNIKTINGTILWSQQRIKFRIIWKDIIDHLCIAPINTIDKIVVNNNNNSKSLIHDLTIHNK